MPDTKKRPDLSAVICLWECTPHQKDTDPDWNLVESFAVDEDAHVITESKKATNDRCPWDKWIYRSNRVTGENVPIMGRAVTCWSFRQGIRMLHFTPPIWCRWLSVSAIEGILKWPNWSMILEGGPKMWFETETAAKRILTEWYSLPEKN